MSTSAEPQLLVDADGAPVPLPYYTTALDGSSLAVYDFREDGHILASLADKPRAWLRIGIAAELWLISEAEYMAAQWETEL